MALKKEIELENGIVTNYHRVVSVNNITNISSTIEVASYINEKQREKESEYQKLQMKSAKGEELTEEEKEQLEKGINVMIDTKYYQFEYDKNLNVDNSYAKLKELEIFKESDDV